MWSKPACITAFTSSAYAGSYVSRLGTDVPIIGVPIDWCAPPSGPSVIPDGVPMSMKRERM